MNASKNRKTVIPPTDAGQPTNLASRRALLLCCLVTIGLLALGRALAAETKTIPARDVFVENSTTNFAFVAKLTDSTSKSVVAFELKAPVAGDYTLVSFIDGREWKVEDFKSPGTFKLATRGMDKGKHRITLQLVDSKGGVGCYRQTIQVD